MVSGNCMIYTWFGDWVSFAFSVQQSAQILGQMANQFISPIINEHYGKDGFQLAYLFGLIICIISVLCALVIAIQDYLSDRAEGLLGEKTEVDEGIKMSDVKQLNRMFWMVTGICIFSDYVTWTIYEV